MVAQIALELGRAGVNINDMALYPASDMKEGVIAMWIAGDAATDARAGADRGPRLPGGAAVNARFEPGLRLRGRVAPPADKSISHRAAIIGAMASEPVRIANYLDAADTRSTLDAVRRVGALVEHHDGEVLIRGCGMRNAHSPAEPIDVGNAGTLMRLLPGWLAFQQGAAFTLDGDASIRRRPVDRIAGPLAQMGAQLDATEGRYPPFTVHGAGLHGITYELPVASAQVKSCVLLAGLATDSTTVLEAIPSRDHTERMLASAGARVARSADRGRRLRLHRGQRR